MLIARLLILLACGLVAGSALGAPFAYVVRGDVEDQLYVLDLGTGAATAVGPVGFGDVEALAIHPRTRVLHGVDDVTNQLVTIDPATGAGTAVGPLGVAITDMGLTFDGAGNLFNSSSAPARASRRAPPPSAPRDWATSRRSGHRP